ncbi:hypothetical protein SODG_006777 [Sodalis praecaptivus]
MVRVALGRAITQHYFQDSEEIQVIGLDVTLERVLLQALQNGGGMEPGMADRLLAQAQSAVQRQESLNAPLVLMVGPALRPLLARFYAARCRSWRCFPRRKLAMNGVYA